MTEPLRLDALDLPGLEAFLAIAREGSVVRAAAYLRRTQPSVSARLASLEARWQVRLFRRTGRGMVLTEAGRDRLPAVEQAWSALSALAGIEGQSAAGTAEWRLGTGDALGRRLLPNILRSFLRRDPQLRFRLVEGPRDRLLDRLRDGTIDLAWIPEDTRSHQGGGIDVAPLVTSAVVVLAPKDFGRRRFRAADLARERWIGLPGTSSFRRWLERGLRSAGVRTEPAIEVGSLSLVRRFVAAGLGLAPVPAIAFGTNEGKGVTRALRFEGLPQIRYLTAVRTGAPAPGFRDPLQAALREELKKGFSM
jgi:DNA-binding transcriptional LysR family regulator